jgi:hypothetical protein
MGNLVPKSDEIKCVTAILKTGNQGSKRASALPSIGMTKSRGNRNGTLVGKIFYCLKADYCGYSYT